MCKKTCMAVQLTDYMTAADVIQKFRSNRKNSFKGYGERDQLSIPSPTTRCRSDSNIDKDEYDALSLYECGGNIGEYFLYLLLHFSKAFFTVFHPFSSSGKYFADILKKNFIHPYNIHEFQTVVPFWF